MKTLGVLKRLAKQAVDKERLALQEIADQIAEAEGQIHDLKRSIGDETSTPLDVMTSGATLNAFLVRTRLRIGALESHLIRLGEAREAQLQRVREERVEEKRFERLAQRRAAEQALEAAEREQKTIDELAAISPPPRH